MKTFIRLVSITLVIAIVLLAVFIIVFFFPTLISIISIPILLDVLACILLILAIRPLFFPMRQLQGSQSIQQNTQNTSYEKSGRGEFSTSNDG